MDNYEDVLRSLSNEQLHAMVDELNDLNAERARAWWKRKRQRDAERYMDVRCPACGAGPRTRCLDGSKRVETSHAERAWKTHPCPVCNAGPGEWCRDGALYVTRAHAARVSASLANRPQSRP